MRLLHAVLAGLGLLGPALVGGGAAPVTITDPLAFLVQGRCPDGLLQVAEPACPARAQLATDPMRMRRHDWPPPKGYMAQDAVVGPDGPETLWDFIPLGVFQPAAGDGGEVYAVEGDLVRIALTQDGGKPYLQGFYGKGCGGSGWIAFRTDAPTGRWAGVVARLGDAPVPGACKASSRAFTRYRLEAVAAPWIIHGRRVELTLPTVISEHYNSGSIARASRMERSFFARGAGRIIWEAWTTGAVTSPDLQVRCPGSNWSAPPGPGWRLSDCRYATNLVIEDPVMTATTFGWPPRVEPLP